MVKIKVKGNTNRIEHFLKKNVKVNLKLLEKYGEMGVNALAAATPRKTGRTAESWGYEIVETPNGVAIRWTNSNIQDGVPIAVVINYGHATRDGGYVKGEHYIEPAMRPVFKKIAKSAWEEVMLG